MRRSLGEPPSRRAIVAALLQVALMVVLLAAYGYGRHLADGRPGVAFENARGLWELERLLRLPDEAALQRAVLGWDGWVRPANEYYVRVHFPASILFMVWIYVRHRAAWPRVRAVVLLSAALALVIHFGYPLAPPRLLEELRLVDLMTVYGPSSYQSAPGEGTDNQFAAMPSLHVGWALMVAWGVLRYAPGRWRLLAIVHPVVTLLVVVLTANHYWLDGAVGAAVVVLALLVTVRLEARPAPALPRTGAAGTVGAAR